SGISIGLLHGHISRISHSTINLHTLVHDIIQNFRPMYFGNGTFYGKLFHPFQFGLVDVHSSCYKCFNSILNVLPSSVTERLARKSLYGHFSEFCLDSTKSTYRDAKLLSFVCILKRKGNHSPTSSQYSGS